MSHSLLKTYPSGFRGSIAVAQTDPMSIRTLVNLPASAHIPMNHRFTASSEVMELMARYSQSRNGKDGTVFKFNEDLLKCAIRCFATDTIAEWIEDQVSSDSIDSNHYAWIEETILQVTANRKRRIVNQAWMAILTADSNRDDNDGFMPITKAFLVKEREMSMRKFLVHWCRCVGGMDDLLSSLIVMFGSRQGQE